MSPMGLRVFAVTVAVLASTAAQPVEQARADVTLGSCLGFHQTTPGTYQCVVPDGMSALTYIVTGGRGGYESDMGNAGGRAARITGSLTVSGSQVLTVVVGGAGGSVMADGAGGGGYSSVGDTSGDVAWVIAGGGGGAGWGYETPVGGDAGIGDSSRGGGQGGAVGSPGESAGTSPAAGAGSGGGGTGGTVASANGVSADQGGGGGAGFGGQGGASSSGGAAGGANGGGGGGWWGGGGGGGYGGGGGGAGSDGGGGGGGGSSLVPDGATAVLTTPSEAQLVALNLTTITCAASVARKVTQETISCDWSTLGANTFVTSIVLTPATGKAVVKNLKSASGTFAAAVARGSWTATVYVGSTRGDQSQPGYFSPVLQP